MQSISQIKKSIKTSRIAFVDKVTIQSRENTFLQHNWPKMILFPPNVMAKAGFFYTGHNDDVSCFYCGVGLQDWGTYDDPFLEHALHSHTCPYINMYKWREQEESLEDPRNSSFQTLMVIKTILYFIVKV